MSWKGRDIPLLTLWAFLACYGETFTFFTFRMTAYFFFFVTSELLVLLWSSNFLSTFHTSLHLSIDEQGREISYRALSLEKDEMELQSFTRTQHLLPWTDISCSYDFILLMMTHQKLELFFWLNTVRKWALRYTIPVLSLILLTAYTISYSFSL